MRSTGEDDRDDNGIYKRPTPPLSAGVAAVAVLDAEDGVRAGAPAGALLQEAAAPPQGRRRAALRLLARAPRLAEAVVAALPGTRGAVPQHLVGPGGGESTGRDLCVRGGSPRRRSSPSAVAQDVPAVEGVHAHAVLQTPVLEDGVPAVEQKLVLERAEVS